MAKDYAKRHHHRPTKLSAAFACVLDSSRAPILEALLKMDEENVARHIMYGNDFGRLIRSQHDVYDELGYVSATPEVTLAVASLFTGNFTAFVSVMTRIREFRTEPTLHFASFLGLPEFVAWLLQKNEKDANEATDDYDFWIPLAVACRVQPLPECVFADSNSWTKRHKKTMRLLAKKTDTSWRSLSKQSVLHIALDYGPEVTKLMVDALDIRHDHLRDEKYLYEDRDGLFYSPNQYVIRLLRLEETADEKALLEALAAGKCHLDTIGRCSQSTGNNLTAILDYRQN